MIATGYLMGDCDKRAMHPCIRWPPAGARRLLQPLQECRIALLHLRVVGAVGHQRAHAPRHQMTGLPTFPQINFLSDALIAADPPAQ